MQGKEQELLLDAVNGYQRVVQNHQLGLVGFPLNTCHWFAQGNEQELLLDAVNGYQRALQYQHLEKDLFGAANPPGFVVEVRQMRRCCSTCAGFSEFNDDVCCWWYARSLGLVQHVQVLLRLMTGFVV